MTFARRTALWAAVAALAAAAALTTGTNPVAAQDEPKKENRLGGFLFDPERVFDEVAKGLGKHYSLDQDQVELARQIVGSYGRKFLERNADELRSLQLEALKFQFLGKPDPETIRGLAKRVKNILSDARDIIEESSDEFALILNDDQRARHEVERKQVGLLLQVVDLEIDKVIRTGALPGPEQNGVAGRLNAALSDSDEARRAGRRFTGAGFLERTWEAYVGAFAGHYKLDADQVKKAQEMLALAKKDAADYRKTNESKIKDFAASYKKLVEAAAERGLSDEAKARIDADRKALDAEADRFEAPLQEMFDQLKIALDTLPTAEQKARAGPFPLRDAKRKR
jgi:hypothetical protein